MLDNKNKYINGPYSKSLILINKDVPEIKPIEIIGIKYFPDEIVFKIGGLGFKYKKISGNNELQEDRGVYIYETPISLSNKIEDL